MQGRLNGRAEGQGQGQGPGGQGPHSGLLNLQKLVVSKSIIYCLSFRYHVPSSLSRSSARLFFSSSFHIYLSEEPSKRLALPSIIFVHFTSWSLTFEKVLAPSNYLTVPSPQLEVFSHKNLPYNLSLKSCHSHTQTKMPSLRALGLGLVLILQVVTATPVARPAVPSVNCKSPGTATLPLTGGMFPAKASPQYKPY
jgi:hypothetical protein